MYAVGVRKAAGLSAEESCSMDEHHGEYNVMVNDQWPVDNDVRSLPIRRSNEDLCWSVHVTRQKKRRFLPSLLYFVSDMRLEPTELL